MNIIALIPVGGKGSRLNLSFPKQLLPIFSKNYKPVIKYTTDCLLENSSVKQILFLHGKQFKSLIVDYYKDPIHQHILQKNSGFANTLVQAYNHISDIQYDGVYYALPDTVYYPNPFILPLNCSTTFNFLSKDPNIRVDRINETGCYDIKSPKTISNSYYHWGSFFLTKLDFIRLCQLIKNQNIKEIGFALNKLEELKYYYLQQYFDLGTWESLFAFYKHQINQKG